MKKVKFHYNHFTRKKRPKQGEVHNGTRWKSSIISSVIARNHVSGKWPKKLAITQSTELKALSKRSYLWYLVYKLYKLCLGTIILLNITSNHTQTHALNHFDWPDLPERIS